MSRSELVVKDLALELYSQLQAEDPQTIALIHHQLGAAYRSILIAFANH